MTKGEISKKTNLPESTLRYYEKKKLIKVIKVERDNIWEIIQCPNA